MLGFHNGTGAIVISLASLLLVSSANAQGEGSWYVGADIGVVDVSVDAFPLVQDKNLSDTAIAVRAGYRLSRHFAVESTYARLGDHSYTLACPSICVPESFPIEIKTSGDRWDVSLLGSIPFGNRLEGYARLGVATTSFTTRGRSLSTAFRSSTSDVSEVYGVGLRVLFDGPWSLRLQWDRGRFSKNDKLETDALWLGAEYRFIR